MSTLTYCSLLDCGTWDRPDPHQPGMVIGLVQCLGTSNFPLLRCTAGGNKEEEDLLLEGRFVTDVFE